MLHDVLHAREESARHDRLCSALIVLLLPLLVIVACPGRARLSVARAQSRIPLRAVLLAYALANSQALHELRPPLEHGLLPLLLLLLRGDVLGFPVCLNRASRK